ncbi:unnamed protein product, partial [marine sediment metagenome]
MLFVIPYDVDPSSGVNSTVAPDTGFPSRETLPDTLPSGVSDGAEKGLLFGIATAGLWFFFGRVWLADLSQPLWAGF